MPDTAIKIAIIGSGPSGCYSAQFLRKAWPRAEITIFDALPVPYGLVRYGVAADHQGSKSVTAQFDRLFERENVAFAGNVLVGADLDFEDLAKAFDVVIAATGLPFDRPLPVAGDVAHRIIGAGAVVRALNGHPELHLPCAKDGRPLPLGRRVAVIGNGNVAMDVVRLLAKPLAMFEGSDIDDDRLRALRGDRITEIDVFGRAPIQEAKFDLAMFKEVLALPNVGVSHTGTTPPDDCAALKALLEMTGQKPSGEVALRFHFRAAPQSLRQDPSGLVLAVQGPDGRRDHAADNVIAAVGFADTRKAGDPCSGFTWNAANAFRVGWLENGGQGTVAANRKSARAVTDSIVAAVREGRLPVGAPGFAAVAAKVQDRLVDFRGWRRIDTHELATGAPGRLRRKISNRALMLQIASDDTGQATLRTA